jgi:Na+/H+ antiporter NhaD/arsenite permease-like protein
MILVAIVVLTSVLSGIFDGATVASIMGIITLTILLSSGMHAKEITMMMLLLVVSTNVGGVWFVLGEPPNILAAEKMGLPPGFFIEYATPFALVAIAVSAVFAWRLGANKERISNMRPELEVLLEGISLRRIHSGQGNLLDTMIELGEIEIKKVKI